MGICPVPTFFIKNAMFRLKEIDDALLPLVGWQQAYNPEEQIDANLCVSESGLTFQGAHPLCTLNNIRSIMPDDYILNYPEWNMLVPYKVGKKVRYNDKVWICNIANTGLEPQLSDFNKDFNNDFGSDTAGAWVVYNMASDYIRNMTIEGINAVVQQFIMQKQLTKETRNLLERRTFFDGAARLAATINSTDRLVGFEIVPVRAMGVTARIDKIGLQMVGAVGQIRIYLFHSSQVAPMQVVDVEFTNSKGGFQWFTPKEPLYLPYIGENNDSGGAWYLCYNQRDLPRDMQALNVSKDWSRDPCATCIGGSIESWRELTKYLQISPFAVHVASDFREYPEMFDVSQIAYTNTMNYGMNCEISVGCDLTDFIISQRQVFASVVQKQVAVNALRTMAMNPEVRVNRNQSNVSRNDILYEIEGNAQGRANGLGYDLKKAYEALAIDTRGLDRICLACNNHGVRYRVV